MSMLVTKLSDGRYKNEGELFAEPISEGNVKLMGEMIALQVLRVAMRFDFEVVPKLYNGLIRDLHRMNNPEYIISDGYDYAQIAISFLWQCKGRYVSEIYGDTKRRKNVTIKSACFSAVDSSLLNFRRKIAKLKAIDFTDNRKMPVDPVDCFGSKQSDYSKVDAIISAMNLNNAENETLNCYMSGWKQTQVCLILGITRGALNYRRNRIRYKYNANIRDNHKPTSILI